MDPWAMAPCAGMVTVPRSPTTWDQNRARLGEVFPPATVERLQALKRELDPRSLFRDNFNVDPGGTTTDAPPPRRCLADQM